MRNYIRIYMWIFFILLFIIIVVFFVFRQDKTLRNDLYRQGEEIDTTMQVEIDEATVWQVVSFTKTIFSQINS